MKPFKVLSALLTSGLLVTAIAATASSPDAWAKHNQEVIAKCLRVSNLRNAKPVGSIIRFGDDVGYDALLVRGTYPQTQMNNQTGQSLCLFNRRTRQASAAEAR